ncbi:Protein Asterix [Balamuthia mandrillaris]
MHKGLSSKIGGDPRRPAEERKFNLSTRNPEENPDYISMLSLMLGLFGLLMKYRIFSLASFTCCIIAVANMKYSEVDVKQLISCFVISTMGIFMAYFGAQAKQFQ